MVILCLLKTFFRNVEDEHLKWLEDVFIPYLKNWRDETVERFGSSSKRSFLTQQTYDGLCITTKAMVELVPYLLRQGLEFVSTRRISQDSLEFYFGHQRSIGRRNENPNIHQFGYRNNAITMKRQLSYVPDGNDEPLKKRRRSREADV